MLLFIDLICLHPTSTRQVDDILRSLWKSRWAPSKYPPLDIEQSSENLMIYQPYRSSRDSYEQINQYAGYLAISFYLKT